MRIKWLDVALNDLISLREYIANEDPRAAKKVSRKIIESISVLATHPNAGRPGRVLNTRELVVAGYPYLVPYRVNQNEIIILRVFHTSMQWAQ